MIDHGWQSQAAARYRKVQTDFLTSAVNLEVTRPEIMQQHVCLRFERYQPTFRVEAPGFINALFLKAFA